VSRLLAAIYDPFMRGSERASLGAWRRELVGDLAGKVLEIGAGTGRNLDHYPASLDELVLAEPDPHMRARLERAVSATGRPARVLSAEAAEVPLGAESVDAVVSTLVLCSVVDPARVLAEIARVLRPGGKLLFLEHVAADDRPDRLAWQERLEPIWSRLAGGCHLTRRTHELIEKSGFELEWTKRESARKALPIVRTTVRGVAKKRKLGAG
jgi:ubiquinone/menaquinone biosynthesis C-methylase UbiE